MRRLSLIWFVAAVSVAQAWACGPDYSGPTLELTLFNPATLDLPNLMPTHYRFQEEGSEAYDIPDEERNCREWAAYLGSGVDWQDVYEVLYLTNGRDFAEKQQQNGFGKNSFMRAVVSRPLAKRYLELTKRAELVLHATDDPWFVWAYPDEEEQRINAGNRKFDVQGAMLASREAFEKLGKEAASDAFLTLRCVYQTLVHARYMDDKAFVISQFEKHFRNADKTVLKWWAMLHYVECLEPDMQVRGQYLLTLIYDNSTAKRERAWHLRETSLREQVLAICTTNHERATAMAFYGRRTNGPMGDEIAKMLELDPQNKFLPGVIAREINKLEDWVTFARYAHYQVGKDDEMKSEMTDEELDMDPYETDYYTFNYALDLDRMRKLQTTLSQAVAKGALRKQADFLRLAAAHLALLDYNPQAAQTLLADISANAALAIKVQQKTAQLLALALLRDVTRPEVKADIMAHFSYIEANQKALRNGAVHLSHTLFYLARAFEKRGDNITAWLLINRAQYTQYGHYTGSNYYMAMHYLNRFGTPDDIEKAIAFVSKTTKDAFDTWLMSPLPSWVADDSPVVFADFEEYAFNIYGATDDVYSLYGDRSSGDATFPVPPIEQLYELAGTIYLRLDNLPKSIEWFSKLPADYWEKTYEFGYYLTTDPFEPFYQEAYVEGEYPERPDTGFKANKLNFVKTIAELREKIKNNPANVAELYFKLGIGLYNITANGPNWMMTQYGQSINDFDFYDDLSGSYVSTGPLSDTSAYYECARAIEMFQKSVETAPKGSEIAAKAGYWLQYARYIAACRRFSRDFNWESDPLPPTFRTPDMVSWAKNHRNTEFYRHIIAFCPELEDY